MLARILLSASCLFVFVARPSAHAADDDSPLAPLAYWVGGVWRGELPPDPHGNTVALETGFSWMNNRQAIVFETRFVAGDRSAPYCSGIYGWDPGRNAIAFWYFDSEGTLYQGTVGVEGDVLAHDFSATARDGKSTAYRARVKRLDADSYENLILHHPDGEESWEPMATVRYVRSAKEK